MNNEVLWNSINRIAEDQQVYIHHPQPTSFQVEQKAMTVMSRESLEKITRGIVDKCLVLGDSNSIRQHFGIN